MNPVEPSIGSRLRILGILSGCMILVESPNPFITKEAHQYKRILILQVEWLSILPTEVAWEHMPIPIYMCTVLFEKERIREARHARFEDARPEQATDLAH